MSLSRNESAKISALIVLIGCIGFLGPLIATILLVIIAGWQIRDWLNEGWVSNSQLEEARDKWMRSRSPLPGRKNVDWHRWAIKTFDDVVGEDDFPGDANHAVFPYLLDEHDADEMDRLLTNRIWPSYCDCERQKGRPWTIVHVLTCPKHSDYVHHSSVEHCRPTITPRLAQSRIQFSCGCYAIENIEGDCEVVRREMCGRDHHEELNNPGRRYETRSRNE